MRQEDRSGNKETLEKNLYKILTNLGYSDSQIQTSLPIAKEIYKISKEEGVDPALALSYAHNESTLGSSSTNVFQLTPIALKDVGESATSIRAGIKYIKLLQKRAKGMGIKDPDEIMASYYAGVGNVAKHSQEGTGLDFVPAPQYNSITAKEYVDRVKNTLGHFKFLDLNLDMNSQENKEEVQEAIDEKKVKADLNSRNAGASESVSKNQIDKSYRVESENASTGLSEPLPLNTMNKEVKPSLKVEGGQIQGDTAPDLLADFRTFQDEGTSLLTKKPDFKLPDDHMDNIPDIATASAADTAYQGTGGNGEQAAFFKYYMRGLLFGHKLGYDVSDDVLPQSAKNAAEFLGNITNAIGTTVLSGGLADVVMGSAFISSMLDVSKAVNSAFASYLNLGKVAKYGDVAVKAGVRAFIQGGIYNGVQQTFRPEDKKLTQEEMKINTAMFVAGDVGRAFSTTGLEALNISGATKQFINFAVDTTASALGGFAIHGDLDQTLTDIIGPQSIAFALGDQLLYAISKGKVNLNRFNQDEYNTFIVNMKMFSNNNTYQNAKNVVSSLDAFLSKAIKTVDTDSLTSYFRNLTLERKADFTETFNKGVKGEVPSYVDVDIKKTRVLQDPITKEFKQIKFQSEADAETFDLIQHAKDETISPEQAKKIETEVAKRVAHEKYKKELNDLNYDEIIGGVNPNKVHMVEPDVPKEIQAEVNWKKKELLREHGWTTSDKEAVILKEEHKPSEGYTLNTTRLNASPETLKEIASLADMVEQTLNRTDFETIDAKSKDVVSTVEELGVFKDEMKELAALTKAMPEKMVALRKMIVDTGEQVHSKAKALQELISKGVEPSDLDIAQFRYLVDLQADLTTNLKQVYRNVGQTLSAGRINVGGGEYKNIIELTPETFAYSPDAVSKVNQSTQGLTDKDKRQIKLLINKIASQKVYDPKKLNKAIKNRPLSSRILEAFIDYRRANLLTSFKTHGTNIISQAFNSLNEGAVNYMAAAIDGTKRFLKRPDAGEMTWKEANARVIGNMQGMYDAWKHPIVTFNDIYGITHGQKSLSVMDQLAMRIFKPKEYLEVTRYMNLGGSRIETDPLANGFTSDAFPELEKIPLGQTIAKVMDYFGSTQKLFSYSLLEAGDSPFSLGAYNAELMGFLARYQENMGATDAEIRSIRELAFTHRKKEMLLPAFVREYKDVKLAEKKLEEFLGVEFSKMDKNRLEFIKQVDKKALEHSKDMTWKSSLETSFFKEFEDYINRVPVLRILLPFTHTPTKILEKWAYSSGLSKRFYEDLKGMNGIEAKTNAQARFLVSALLYGTGAFLFYNGKITPTARNSNERKKMQTAGLPENAIKIGDKWVQIDRLDPAPSLYFSTIANGLRVIHEDHSDDTALEIAGEIMGNIGHNLVNKTWFIGLKDIMEAVTGIGTDKFVHSMVDSLKPMRGWQSLAFSVTHDYLKDSNAKFLKYRPHLDIFGKPIPIPAELMGLKYYKLSDSPIRQTLLDLNISLPDVPHTLRGVPINEDQRYIIKQEIANLDAEGKLNKLVTKESFKKLPEESKMRQIKNLWDNLRARASLSILKTKEFKEAMKEYQKQKLKDKKKNSTINVFQKYLNFNGGNKNTSSSTTKRDNIDRGLDALRDYTK